MATGKGQAVGFVYALDKTIAEIGADVLNGDDYANKIVFTKEGIVLDGNIVAEPNSDIFGSMVVECYQKETGDNPTTLYSDSACTEATKITPSTAKLYYVKGTGRTLEWVADLGYYATVSDVYTALKGIIDGLGDTYASKDLVQELTLSVSAMNSKVTANANNIATNTNNIATNTSDIKAINDSKGATDGIATLDSDGLVPASQLPQASTEVAGITKLTNSLETQYSSLPVMAGAVTNAFVDLKNNYLPGSYIKSSLMGVANGVVPLNDSRLIDSTYLPSYVDDVIEGYYLKYGTTYAFFSKNEAATDYLITPETGKIYVDLNTNKTYRYGGSAYVEISESLAIGTTDGTAFSGKTGNDHVNNTNNPHSVTKAQVGLGNVDNTADADKSVYAAVRAFDDSAGNRITDTYLRKDAVQSTSLDGKSETEVPSVSLVYNETVKAWTGTQAEYDALSSYDSRTAYLITDASETVYSDLNFGIFYGSNNPTYEEAGAVFHALYTNGVLKNKQVYMRCNTSAHGDSGYHLVEYRGQKTIDSNTYEVFACYIGGEYGFVVAFLGTGESTARYERIQAGKIVYGIQESITSGSTNDSAAGGKAVYDLVSPLITQLTWQ